MAYLETSLAPPPEVTAGAVLVVARRWIAKPSPNPYVGHTKDSTLLFHVGVCYGAIKGEGWLVWTEEGSLAMVREFGGYLARVTFLSGILTLEEATDVVARFTEGG